MYTRQARVGFTIVELLIVVVVIAILAAVTIVAFRGIQENAKLAVLKNDLKSAQKALETYRFKQGTTEQYPADLDAAGVTASGGVDLQYSVNNGTSPPSFCVTAVSVSNVGTAYRITQAGDVQDGACPGHTTNPGFTNLVANTGFEFTSGQTTARTNLALNPGAEAGLTYWSANAAGAATSLDSVERRSGTSSIRTDLTSTGSYSTQLWDGTTTPLVPVVASEVVTISGWAKASTAGSTISISHRWRDSANAQISQASQTATSITTAWTRFSFTATAPAGVAYDHVSFYFNGTAGQSWWLDDVLVEKSISMGNYFDGSSAPASEMLYNWSGTSGLSTSNERGTAVQGYGTNRVANVSTTAWSAGGSRSLMQYPTSTASNDNYTELAGSAVNAGALVPSTTYTIMATVRLTAPLTGTLSGNGSRAFFVHLNGTGRALTGTAQAPNAAGTYELRATFTTPAALTGYNTIRLYHGGYAGSGIVWWDNVALVQGDYTGPYFQ